MIQVEVGVPTEKLSELELIENAKYVETLLSDRRFARLVTNAADGCVHDWSLAPTLEKREAAYYTLQGIHRLLREMSKDTERGVTAVQAVLEQQGETGAATGEETRGVPVVAQPPVDEERARHERLQKLYDQQARGASAPDQPPSP